MGGFGSGGFGSAGFGSGPKVGGPQGGNVSDTTDLEQIQEIQYLLLENGSSDATGTSFLTNMFTVQQVIDTLNERQNRFLRDTGQIVTRMVPPLATTPGQNKFDLPAECIVVRRMAWQDASNNITALVRSDTWEQDHGFLGWPQATGTPFSYWDTTLPHERIAVSPAPANPGALQVLYVALATVLDGNNIHFTVQDDWIPYVLWGALADLLGSDGQAFDPVRSQYCNQRYDEGVELARVVLMGDMS